MKNERTTWEENGVTRDDVIYAARICYRNDFGDGKTPCAGCPVDDDRNRCFQSMPTDPIAKTIMELEAERDELIMERGIHHGLNKAIDDMKAAILSEILSGVRRIFPGGDSR